METSWLKFFQYIFLFLIHSLWGRITMMDHDQSFKKLLTDVRKSMWALGYLVLVKKMSWCIRPTQPLYHPHIYSFIEWNRQTRISAWNYHFPTIIFLVFLCKREIWYRMIIDKPCQAREGILKYLKRFYIVWILCVFICKHGIFYCYHSHSIAENYVWTVTAQYDSSCEWGRKNFVLLMHTYLVIGLASKIP